MLHFALYAEIKPHLSVVQVILRITRDRLFNGRLILEVDKSALGLFYKVENGSCHEKNIKLDNLTMVPDSCHGLQWHGEEELHFRIKITLPDELRIPVTQEKPVLFDESMFKTEDGFSCFCRFCNECLIQKMRFQRVLPLPSDNWHQLADTGFCHKPHKDNGIADLTPRPGDCLISDSHIQVHASSIQISAVFMAQPHRTLMCRRCRATLGLVLGKVKAKADRHSKRSPVEIDRDSSLALHTYALKTSIEHFPSFTSHITELFTRLCREYNCFRFVVYSETCKGEKVPYILMWILDSNTLLCQTSGLLSVKKYTEDLVSQHVIKLMWQDCLRTSSSKLSEAWQKDMTTQQVFLPEDTCRYLQAQLISTNHSLPPSLRRMNEFYVGYLMK